MRSIEPTADRIRAEACGIIATADPRTTPHAVAMWAAGVFLVNRAHHFTTWPLTGDTIAATLHGGSMPGMRWYFGDRTGWQLQESRPHPEEGSRRHTLIRGSWDAMAAMLDPDRVGADLVDAARANVEAEADNAAYFDWERRYSRSRFDGEQRAELARRDAERLAMSREDSRIAAAAWDRCRPAVLPAAPRAIAGTAVPRPMTGRTIVAPEQLSLFHGPTGTDGPVGNGVSGLVRVRTGPAHLPRS